MKKLKVTCMEEQTRGEALYDADTMLHLGCMVRTSVWIKDHGYFLRV